MCFLAASSRGDSQLPESLDALGKEIRQRIVQQDLPAMEAALVLPECAWALRVPLRVEADLPRGEHGPLDRVDLADERPVAGHRHVPALKQVLTDDLGSRESGFSARFMPMPLRSM